MRKGVLLTGILLASMAALAVDGHASAKVQIEYSNAGITVAENGKAMAVIVLGKDAIAPEKTAARELADYLKKATGAELQIVSEVEQKQKGNLIYVGPTKYAAENGLDGETLGEEQWFIRTVNGNLILTGGRPRGTLYAVYHFLEDSVGVHWWSPGEESVPELKQLATGKLNLSGQPAFEMRDLDTRNWLAMLSAPNLLWAPRNRVNGDTPTWSRIPYEYGSDFKYGPPAMCHSEGQYFQIFKSRGDFEKHPEWMAMKDGKREVQKKWADNQLCLSNPDLRQALLAELRVNIKKSRGEQPYKFQFQPEYPQRLFDFSLNDVPGVCQCENCAALVRKYGGKDAGLLLETVNCLADGIKDDYPEVLISTLAYLTTEDVPAGIIPHDNVLIVLCDTRSSYALPIAHNGYFAQRLRDWAKVTEKIRIWDYHSNFSDLALPMPYESTFQADLQLFRTYNAIGYMTQYHHPIYEEMRDLRLWLLAKLLEDPYQDQNKLITDFTDGFYGPAAAHIRQYLALLQQAAAQAPSALTTGSRTASVEYLTPDFVFAAQKLFDQAEQAARKSDVLLRRVRHARMGIDKTTVTIFPRIWQAWITAGNKPAAMPFDREKIAARIKQTVEEQYQLRAPGDGQWADPSYKGNAEKGKKDFLTLIDSALRKKLIVIKPPTKFSHLPKSGYTDYPADSISTGWADLIVEDADSEAGITLKIVLTEAEVLSQKSQVTEKRFAKDYVLSWDMHDYTKPAKGNEPSIAHLKPEDVPGAGYHWYRLGSYYLNENNFLWVYNASLEIPLRSAIDPLYPGVEYDIWARIKFEGPAFPHGTQAQVNAIFVERIVVLKAEKK